MEGNRGNKNMNQAEQFLRDRKGDLGQLVSSKDGESVKRMMEQDASRLKKAVQTGDMQTLKETFDNLMGTEEGARLIGKIQEAMK